MAFLISVSISSYADTTVVIGDGSNEYSTFAAALSAIHGMSNPGRVTILVTKSTVETTTCDLRSGDDLVLTNNSNRRCAIQFDKDINSTRMIAILHGAKLTIGGGTMPLILRASDETDTGRKFFDDGSNVLIKVYGGELDILDNVELCYGKNVIWMTNDDHGNSPVVNMHGGVIHSATDICVNITQGTFNMDGGYICGHYFTGSQIIPDFTANPLLDYSNVRSYYGHDAEESVINPENGIQAYLASSRAYNTEVENLNYAMGVYVHRNENTVDAPTTQFNMSGGVICGINAANEAGHKINIDINGVTYIYYDITDKTRGSAVLVNKSEFNFTGGKIYANYSRDDGPGFRLTDLEYNYVPGYDFGHANMSGNASISYCQCYPNGGGTRVEKGVTFTMSGGEISHCLAGIGYSEGLGGGGGLRLVGAKFVMSGDAEMCWNHSTGLDENYNGGAIGAVWQQAYGTIETVLDLQGGKIHHNLGEANGGGISATDKGNLGATGINVTFNGVKIYENTSKTHGGGVYVGGSADVVIKGNSEIYSNTATGNGGGLYVSSANTGGHIGGIDASACKIYGNSAEMGGGIYTDNAYVDIHAGAQVYGHEITGNGGGVCVMSGASYTQDGGEIGLATSHNKAANGAGVYVGGTGNVTLGGTAMVGYNDATANGGGVFLEGGDFTMENGNVKENTAAVDGGGFSVNGGNVTITGGDIKNNIASTGNGGGFYAGGGAVNISNSTISGNHADEGNGGGLYSATAITVGQASNGTSVAVSGNHAKRGAGFYVAGANDVTTTIQGGSTISDNIATEDGGGAYIASGNLSILYSDIKDNEASTGNGGAIYASTGKVDMNGASVDSNSAKTNGGAFFLGPEAKITLQNGSIEGNSASNGGAIYLSGGAFFEYKTSATGNPGFIRGNTASNLGGGIYLAQGTTSKKTEMKFSLSSTNTNLGFYDNTAEVGADDIYAYGGGTTTINIPNVQSMNLGGYSIPGATLEWWEDYKVGDSRYSEGTIQSDASNITRYRASRDADLPIWKVPTTLLSTFYEKYLCLTLGFEYGKIEIRRAGLKPNENAIYEVKFGDGSQRDIQRVVVYGSDEEGIDVENKHWNVAKLNFLPKGEYTVTEIPWTWYNDNKEPSALSKTQTISEGDGYIFKFENSHHDLTKTPLHDEEFKVNVLKK